MTAPRPSEAEVELVLGSAAQCTDGPCGRLTCLVVDPVARTVTHVIVEPEHRSGLGKLVPVGLVGAGVETVTLRCTLAEFDTLPAAEETQFLPGTSGGYSGFGPGRVLSWPYYGLGANNDGLAMGSVIPPVVVVDLLPAGETGFRRGEAVHATDGEIGRVHGMVIDPHSRRVTHVLLQEGHLWGRRDVAIPVEAVTGLNGGVRLSLTRQQIGDLPPVDIATLP